MRGWVGTQIQLLHIVLRQSRLVHKACRMRDWQHAVAAVLGFSLATNLIAAKLTGSSGGSWLIIGVAASWLVFGIASMWCASFLQEERDAYWRTKKWEDVSLAEHSEQRAQRHPVFPFLPPIQLAAGLLAISLSLMTLVPLGSSFWQLAINGLVVGSQYFIAGIGFATIYQVMRFFNFTHGVIITGGAYIAVLFTSRFALPTLVGAVVGICIAAFLGIATAGCVFQPLKRRGASSLVMLLASLGLYVALQNLISVVFGDATQWIGSTAVREGLPLLGARVTEVQLAAVALAAVILATGAWAHRCTKWGLRVRAVASDSSLAAAGGISRDRVILGAFALGSALGGMVGVLCGLDTGVNPTMGMRILLMGIVVAIVGGTGRIIGIALASVLVSWVQQVTGWCFGAEWKDPLAFLILIIVLVARPRAFLGKRERYT